MTEFPANGRSLEKKLMPDNPITPSELDAYVAGLFAPEDDVLRLCLETMRDAGLPPINVSASEGKMLYLLARIVGWGQAPVLIAVADYGTKFIVVAGLLNFVSAVDAHNLRIGRKR